MSRMMGVVALCAAGCAPAQVDPTVSLVTPQALLVCASAPVFEARLWVSGAADPCPLEVDVDAGTTSGTCDVTPGAERTLTLDWFTIVDHGGDFDLLLAQARGTLDLTTPTDKAAFTVDDDDVKTDACLHMRDDTLDGAQVITVDGAEVPPCDVDESCNGADGACTNLGELCASTDPFDPTVEPG